MYTSVGELEMRAIKKFLRWLDCGLAREVPTAGCTLTVEDGEHIELNSEITIELGIR
jgi:hypothetical protein